jgi:DUF1365 family protein
VRSRLYVGHTTHSRTRPVKNRFRYPIYFVYLDLDELPDVQRSLRIFSHNSANVVSFHDRDHGPRDGSPLKPWFQTEVLGRVGIELGEGGRVAVLSIPKVFGFGFYPVSLWYAWKGDGTPVAVMAEVQNTFRDHHNYLLHNHGEPFDWTSRPSATKVFYVSPFVQVEGVRYEFHFSQPAETLSASVYDYVDDSLLLAASIAVKSQPLTDAALGRQIASVGPMSARALMLIHGQALNLYRKGVPFYSHPAPPTEETSL